MSRVNVRNVNHHYGEINIRHLHCLDSLHRVSPISGWVENVLEILGGHGENQSVMEGHWTWPEQTVSDLSLTCGRR